MRICHVSILNPVFHSRMYHKWALSQLNHGHEVWLIGQDQEAPPHLPNKLRVIPFPSFSRWAKGRFKAHRIILRELKKLQPDLVIIHSPELLWLVAVLKGRMHFHYDVHEDYPQNIAHGHTYPRLLRRILAYTIKVVERKLSASLQTVSYAEKCYENILNVPREKYIVLENKFRKTEEKPARPRLPFNDYLLYTGTITETWGVFDSLQFWAELNQHRNIPLVIAGHTHFQATVERIEAFVYRNKLQDSFLLVGGTQYVAYHKIKMLIAHATAIMGLYHDLPQIRGKLPTKFFEAMAFGKPVIFTPMEAWLAYHQQYSLGIPYFHKESDPLQIWEELSKWEVQHTPEQWAWEEKKLALFMDQHYGI